MGKVEEMMTRREPQDIIEIGEILNKFYSGQAGAIFRGIVNGLVRKEISQTRDNSISCDRRLGRAEGIQILQDEIELAIAQMESLTQPLPQGENNG